MKKIPVREVFKSLGQPTTTYVKRQKGFYEKKLSAAIQTRGKLCLLTGPSKTGKTTLYIKVLDEMKHVPLIVRCSFDLSTDEFWTKALEAISFERITAVHKAKGKEISAGGKIKGKIGWAWLANLIGEVSLGVKSSMGETEIREKIISKPCPEHLIPVLSNLPTILVIEDFHYLPLNIQKNIFQQWKIFVDNEVSVIVVGTTHHAVDLAHANKDLIGRIAQVDLDIWKKEDLCAIADQGLQYLGTNVPFLLKNEIAQESVGLPIITQDVCLQLFIDKGISEHNKGDTINFLKQDVYLALHHVSITNYAQFEAIYQRLITGPRKRARKYDTYELIFSAFVRDPLSFSLRRDEIDERFDKMSIRPEKRPPLQSINSTLKALSKFQTRIGIELLEWSDKDQKLYIVEPSFLFYLRWRTKRTKPPTILETIKALFDKLAAFDKTFIDFKQ